GKEVILNGEVKDGSKVTFTIHEDFPVMVPEPGHADLVHNFTGTVSGGKIYGTFQGGYDVFGIKYRINGQFVVSVDSAGSTTTPTTAANTTTSTPTLTPSQPMDLRGTWSGTHVQSGPGWTAYYNVVLNLTQQEKSLVTGTLALTVLRAEGSVVPMDLTIPFVGTVSGSTLQSAMMGMTCQVSGNSMTGSGTDTNSMGVTWDWSWNITRVP
ncbi:MAG: hypothetical protein Q8P44_08575, partial [Dehalococcoidia bacterium]|nr:hypothetical protein [Dehalococcoidia bacterium]